MIKIILFKAQPTANCHNHPAELHLWHQQNRNYNATLITRKNFATKRLNHFFNIEQYIYSASDGPVFHWNAQFLASQDFSLLKKNRNHCELNPTVLSPTKLSLRSIENLAIKECWTLTPGITQHKSYSVLKITSHPSSGKLSKQEKQVILFLIFFTIILNLRKVST